MPKHFDIYVRTYLRAFVQDWKTGMSGGASILLGVLAIYWSNAPMKALFALAAVACVLFSSYRVWRQDRVSADQTVGLLQQENVQLKDEIVQLRSANQKVDVLEQENSQLKLENEQLRTSPYDKAHRQVTEKKLQSARPLEKELLRFLLDRGETEHSHLESSYLEHPAGTLGQALATLTGLALIKRLEKPRPSRAGTDLFWLITPEFKDDLNDLVPVSNGHYFRI